MTDDTEKARQYAQTPLGIDPIRYGAFLDGRLSIRTDRDELQANFDDLFAKAQEIISENDKYRVALERVAELAKIVALVDGGPEVKRQLRVALMEMKRSSEDKENG